MLRIEAGQFPVSGDRGQHTSLPILDIEEQTCTDLYPATGNQHAYIIELKIYQIEA